MASQYSAGTVAVTSSGLTVSIGFDATFISLQNATTSGDAYVNMASAATSGNFALKSTDSPLVFDNMRAGLDTFYLTAGAGVAATVRLLAVRI